MENLGPLLESLSAWYIDIVLSEKVMRAWDTWWYYLYMVGRIISKLATINKQPWKKWGKYGDVRSEDFPWRIAKKKKDEFVKAFRCSFHAFSFFFFLFFFFILQLWRYFPNNCLGGYSKIVESWKYHAIFFRFTSVINWSGDVEIGKNWGNFIVVYLLLENGVIYGVFLKKQRNVEDILAR